MDDQPRLIESKFAGTCLSCEAAYLAGERVYWVRGVGCWHEDCATPRNLALYIKERDEPKY